jgi:hypothetical protein
MANPHADQTATVFNNGNVLIAGGQNYGQGSILEVEESAAAELYEYATGTWTSVGNMTTARDYAGAALLSNGTVLVAGGAVGGCCSGLSSAEIFDSTTLTWTAIQSMTTGRNGPAASAILNATSVLVSGGYSCCSDPNPTLSSAEDYDVATQSWNLTGSLSQARSFFTSVTLHDGTVLAVGGDFSSAERYYPDANNQTVTIQISNTGVTPVSFSITGTGCSAGTYTSYGKFALNWIPGSSCQVTASAPSGWSFTNWSDGSTANPRTFIVPSVATTYTANFSQSSATPASISATGGTPQSTAVSTAFASPLVAAVENSSGNPVSGVTVTFAAPGSGASGTFAGGVQAATTNAAGVATSAVFTANATAGSYTVTASVAGVSTPASFALTNTVIGGQSTTITLLPSSYVTTQGTSGGQAVSTSIDLLDESGTENIWNKYVEFDGLYAGYQVFTLPPSIVPSSVTNIQIQVNYQGPAISTQTWTWQIYDWVHAAYVSVGTNSGAPDWGTWKLLTFSVPGTLSNYIRSSDGQVRIQLLSNNSADAADIDYEAVIVSY